MLSVFEQQCVVKELSDKMERGSLPEIEIREKPEGDKIISSPHNTDAEYTRKRNQKIPMGLNKRNARSITGAS